MQVERDGRPGTGLTSAPGERRRAVTPARALPDPRAATRLRLDPGLGWDARSSPLVTHHLLLVDDDRLDAALISEALREVAGDLCVLTTAARLAEARQHLTNPAVDCVLLDLSLPDSTGLDTVAGITSAAPDVPVVVLTGLDDEQTAMAAVHAGAQDYLTKRTATGPLLWRTVRYAIERKRAEVAARHLAMHDPLTGLANRTLFVERLQASLHRLARTRGAAAVLFLDLDRFKWVNDSLGHDVGDSLLLALARRLELHLRSCDTVARLGGDQLLILCDDVGSVQNAQLLAERLRELVAEPFPLGDAGLRMTASIGLVVSDDAQADPTALLRDADLAMYRAKDLGSSRCVLYDDRLRARTRDLLRRTDELRQGIEGDELLPHFQPIVDLRTGLAVGAEALARWARPGVGLVSPAEFIPLAEQTGLIVGLGDVMLDSVCRRVAAWQAQGCTGVVTLNVSARQMLDSRFTGRVQQAIARTGVDPAGLGLEITESALMRDEQASRDRMRELKDLGVRLYIDDFGTGYSSLTYLKRFPFDTLKIDHSFTRGLGVDADDTAIIDAVLRLAHSLRLTVVAEGIETEGQAQLLVDLGCELGQGYHLARPSADGSFTARTGLTPRPRADRRRA